MGWVCVVVVVVGDNGGDGQTRQDYLRKVLTPCALFNVPVTQTSVDDCGAVRETTKDAHFQSLNLQHGPIRPTVLNPIGDDDQDTSRKSALSVSIQYLSVWRRSSPAEVTCFFKTDAQFVNALQISEWSVLKSQLMRWDSQPSDSAACIDLNVPKLASSCLSIEDPTCPGCCWLACIQMDGEHIDAGFRESVDGFGLLVHRFAPSRDDLTSKSGFYKFI